MSILRTLVIMVVGSVIMAHAQQRFVRPISNRAAMIASNPSDVNTNVIVNGTVTLADGGEAAFVWVRGDTTATNSTTVFASTYPNAPAGRWRKLTLAGSGSGGGITSLNTQTNATQTMVDGSFTSSSSITSSGGVHTFNTTTNFPMLTVTNNLRIGLEYLTSTNPAINLSSQGTKFWTLTNDATPTFIGVPTDANFSPTVTIIVTNTGAFTIDWDNIVFWPPSDVEVTPMTNTVNTFVFKWDGQQLLGYGDAEVSSSGGTQVFSGTYGGGLPVDTPTTTAALAYDLDPPGTLYFWDGTIWY